MKLFTNAVIQSIVFAIVVEFFLFIILHFYAMPKVLNNAGEESFSYKNSYFFVYHGPFENYPSGVFFISGAIIFTALFLLFYTLSWIFRRVHKK
ncbi:hypothetical protein [Paenibacillus sp. DMB5]|uniref:hypothetical protein n=1 Tax=Paenibacillus sp. DMB5 TaxID=1780103 RepID=UPI00076D0889|nr:hypothetical protein [Paenibacillus sp. DMB5]KUP20895.1 hypothetical protein AWJ19_06410 [Paenibacillus sp. DMB5]